MKLEYASRIASYVQSILTPVCEPGRCLIVGSVGRRAANCGDIELVTMPREAIDLFGAPAGRLPAYARTVESLGKVIKGDPKNGRMCTVCLPDGINLELYTAKYDNWGLIVAIRYGSAEFSHNLLSNLNRRGMICDDGRVHRVTHDGRTVIPTPEEINVFELAGVEYVPPQRRSV